MNKKLLIIGLAVSLVFLVTACGNDTSSSSSQNEAAMNIPMKRHGKPDEVADLILFLISDHAKYITGESIVIDGGLSLII